MKLYVGNLSYSATEAAIESLFAAFGGVLSVKIMTDKYTGQSRGFAFVEMDSKESGLKAISELNGTEVSGRKIVVNEAQPRENRDNNRGGGGGQGGGGNRRPGNGGPRRH